MSIADIKRLNNLNGNLVNAGRSILVTKNTPALQTAFESVASIDIDNTPDTYRSNMPAEPVNITLAAVQVQPIQAANVAVTPIEPATPTPKNDSLIVQNQTGIEDTPQVLSQKQTPIPSEVKATEPVQNITQNGVQTEDELMQLIAQNNLRRLAEESVSNVIDVPDSVAEHKISAPSQHIVVANNKRQTRLETRIARAADTDISPLHASIHRVVEGDTLFNIAKRYNVSVADLIITNNIKGNTIQKGQVLRLAQAKPAKTHIDKVSYTIQKGDTFKSISARFNINIDDIRRLNPDLNTISPGQRIKLIGS